MGEYKYPYIPKEYYPAVMYACKLIREYGTFNVACETAADDYGVDVEEVKKHVRKRQGAGQKGMTRKYKHFLFVGYTDWWVSDYDFDCLYSQRDPEDWKRKRKLVWHYQRATSLKNARKSLRMDRMGRDGFMHGEIVQERKYWEFNSEEEAKKFVEENGRKIKEEVG